MATSNNRLLELRLHPPELPKMMEALYLWVISSHVLLWVCCDCCGLSNVSNRGWLNLEFPLSSRATAMEEDLCETSWWISTGIINWLLPHFDICSGWLLLKNYSCKGLLLSTMAQKYWVCKLTVFLSHSRQEAAFVQRMWSTWCYLTWTSLLHVFRLGVIHEELLVQGPSFVHCGSEILCHQAHNVSVSQ